MRHEIPLEHRVLSHLSLYVPQGVLELAGEMRERVSTMRTALGHLVKQGKVIARPQVHDRRKHNYLLKGGEVSCNE